MKKVLIYHRRSNLLLGGDCFLLLYFTAAFQKTCKVTLFLNQELDIGYLAQLFDVDIDFEQLKIVRSIPPPRWLRFCKSLGNFISARQLKGIAKNADICISTLNIVDFGKPGHHFICAFSGIEGKAFQDFVNHVRTRTGLRLFGRKISTWLMENLVKPLWGIRPTQKIINSPDERIYPNSRYVETVMQEYFGTFNSTVFYPPTTAEFTRQDIQRDPWKIVYVGRLYPSKRITDIIAIVENARKFSGKDLQLDIAGELPTIPYSDTLRQMAAEQTWLHLVGPVYGKDKEALLLSATYAIHAERDEAFGINITEYLKAGIIPIVPAEGGAYEVADNQQLAYHTNQEAAQILARLLDDGSFRDAQRHSCAKRAQCFTRQAYFEQQQRTLAEILHVSP